MSVLDELEAVLRARTGRRIYGTPFYEDKLKEMEQAAQGRDIGNQQAAFSLSQEQAMAPGAMEQQGLKTEGMRIGNQTASAKASKAEQDAAAYGEVLRLNQERGAAEIAYKSARTEADRKNAEARLVSANAAMHRALNPSASTATPSFSTVQTQDENGQPILMRVNPKDPTGTLVPFTLPGGTQGPLGSKPLAADAAKTEIHAGASRALDAIDHSLGEFERARASGNPRAAAEALKTYQAQLQLIGNILGKASGDQRIGDKERPVYASVAGVTNSLVNIADPGIARRRLAEARKFLDTIKPGKSKYGIKTGSPAENSDPLGIR